MSAARERVASQNTKKAHPTAAQDSVLLNCLIRIFGASGIVDTAGREKRRDEAFVEADQTENKGFHVGLWRMAYRLWQMANGLSLITLHAIPIRYLPLAIGYLLSAIGYRLSAIGYLPSAIFASNHLARQSLYATLL